MTLTAFEASSCAVCGRPLTDVVSIACAVGPDCRATYGYDAFDLLQPERRIEMRRLLHAIAADSLQGDHLRQALFRIVEFGFRQLADRIERRVWRRIAPQVEISFEAPPAAPVLGKIDMPFALTQGQEEARQVVQRVRLAKGHACAFIVGYAGTGKTTVIKVFSQEHGKIQIITPTGRAALRVRQATGLDASTIHRWLYKPKENEKTGAVSFVRREANDIAVPQSRIILIDEASMVGPDLWKDIIAVCQQMDLKLVCVGDGFQLPPVQAPNAPPFSILTPEFAAQLGAERVELTEVLRQAQDSPIIRASMSLRAGWGMQALTELRRFESSTLAQFIVSTHQHGGVTICHRNVTRMQINAAVRMMLGIRDEMPQKGEPLVVLKNCYEAGVVNGEAVAFDGWEAGLGPEIYERVYDRYKGVEEQARFGATRIGGNTQVVMALEELHGRLQSSPRAVEIAGSKWARLNNLYASDTLAPTVHCNFGYAWTAHKCVHPDTLVETKHGLQRISAIAEEGQIATAKGIQNYRALVSNPVNKMVRVRTKDGYTVDVTPDHGLFVWNGDDYVRVEARNIQPGAFVRLHLLQQFITPLREPVLPPAPETDVRATQYAFPTRLTEDAAELLGLMVADGTITPRGTIRLAKRYAEVTDRFAELCLSVFGATARITPNYNGTRAFCAELHAKQIADWLRVVGGMEPNNKFVPPTILQAPMNAQARFLRGLFEDGTVNVKRGIMDHIEWSNCTEEVVATVQTMLLRFGIIAGRRTRVAGEHAQTMLYIYGENAHRFGTAIGFVSRVKTERVTYPTGAETGYAAPFSLADRAIVWSSLSNSERGNLRTRGTLSRDRMGRVIARGVSIDVRRLLDEKLRWHHTRVTTVEPIEDAPSMCVEVPACGRFLQNGFDGSNSQGSEWPYVLVCIEPSVRLDEEDGRRWTYTAITRAEQQVGLHFGRV